VKYLSASRIDIVSPSYKRAGNTLADHLFGTSLTFAIHEFEQESYEKEYPENPTWVIPDTLRGNMAAVRNWIMNHFRKRYLLMVDDDVKRIGYKGMLLRRSREAEANSPYVFHRLQRCQHPEREAQRKFRKECRRIGILPVEGREPSLRVLRRTQITELAHELAPFELQSFCGHESPNTTSKYYVHLRCEDLGKKLARVNQSHLSVDLYETQIPSLHTPSQRLESQDVTTSAI